jgi:hypothetical protein
MPNTYKKIASVVVGSGGSSAINFTSIPQTFTDLKIVLSGRSLQGNVYGGGRLEFNSSTNNYSWRRLRADGSAAASDNSTSAASITNWDMNGANATASVFSNIEFYIPNYTNSNYKSVFVDYVGENNATEAHMGMVAGLWSDTSAITSIKLYSGGGNLVQHTTATLYGIGDVTASKFAKATGGLITYDSTYVYHTFTSSGTFTPNTALNVDYLVVAGGGGGGAASGGGGGAGGVRSTITATGGGGSLESPLSLSSGSAYTVTIGSGGAAAVSGTSAAAAGSNSVFSSITSTGGGRGASATDGHAATSGGSGGGGATIKGASGEDLHQNTGGSGTASQGYAGGTTTSATVNGTARGAGGGGAGSVGATGSANSNGGNGGSGITTSISGISTSYAGGGGGGSQGGTAGTATAGGGNGSNSSVGAASSGTANTGGGGGGGGVGDASRNGGAGGSGIVIVRYPR